MPKETVAQQNERVRRERAAAFDARAGAGRVGPPMPPKMADSAGATGGPSFAKNPMATGRPNQMLPKGNPGAGGFKGVAKPGEAVQVMLNGKKAFISGSAITDDSGPSPAPRSFLNDIGDAAARSRKVYANRDAGLTSGGQAPERKVNMRAGMGNTDAKKVFAEKPSVSQGMLAEDPLKFISANSGIPMGKALGYGTSLLKRGLEKGNTGMVKADYVERLKGSDVFRKLDSTSQGHVLKAYNQWLNTQSAFNEGKRKQMAVDKDFNRTFGKTDGMF